MLYKHQLEQLKATVDFEELQQETEKLIRLTYNSNVCEIYQYLQSDWLDEQICRI